MLATDAGATLTEDVVGQTGAVWWKTPYTFDAFDMTATFTIREQARRSRWMRVRLGAGRHRTGHR